jgi:hypothetical protein
MSVGPNLRNLAIGYSRVRLLTILGGCLLLTLLFTAITLNLYRSKDISAFQTAVCYFGLALSVFASCRALWMLFSSGKPVVFLSRVGIRDVRLADETIAWSSVRDILIWERRGQKVMVLKLDPILAQRFAGGPLNRILSLMSKALGAAEGVIINAGGLTMEAETLFDTCRQYWGAGRSGYVGRALPETEPEPESVS